MKRKENLFQDDVKVGVVKVKEGQVKMELVGSNTLNSVREFAWRGSHH